MRGCTRDNMITIVSFGECNRGSRISKPIDINAESLHRSSIGRAVADVISCGYSSSSHPPGNREIVTSYHSASTLKTPSSTGLPSTSMGRQHSVTLALAVEDVLLITNSPTKAGAHRCRHPTHFVNKFEVPKLRA